MRRRSSGHRQGARLVSNPLILVATALLVVGLLGTVVHVAGVTVPADLAVWCLICSNLLLLVGAFSREM